MLYDPIFWAAAVAAIGIAGVSKGGFGSGAAFAATPMLAVAAGPSTALAVMLPILLLMDLSGLWAFRHHLNWRAAGPLMAASLIGLAIGGATYRYISDGAVQLLIGAVALGFLAQRRFGGAPTARGAPKRAGWGRAGLWGAAAGFTSFLAHAGGPLVAMHLIPQRLDKTAFQGATVLFFAFANLVKTPAYAALGLFTPETLTASLALAPLAPLGVALGVWAHRRVDEILFYRVISALLLLSGLRLIWVGAADLWGAPAPT